MRRFFDLQRELTIELEFALARESTERPSWGKVSA